MRLLLQPTQITGNGDVNHSGNDGSQDGEKHHRKIPARHFGPFDQLYYNGNDKDEEDDYSKNKADHGGDIIVGKPEKEVKNDFKK